MATLASKVADQADTRALAADQPQSLTVIATLAGRVPYLPILCGDRP